MRWASASAIAFGSNAACSVVNCCCKSTYACGVRRRGFVFAKCCSINESVCDDSCFAYRWSWLVEHRTCLKKTQTNEKLKNEQIDIGATLQRICNFCCFRHCRYEKQRNDEYHRFLKLRRCDRPTAFSARNFSAVAVICITTTTVKFKITTSTQRSTTTNRRRSTIYLQLFDQCLVRLLALFDFLFVLRHLRAQIDLTYKTKQNEKPRFNIRSHKTDEK